MKPILFNTEMVRAILDGKKTTTRRAVKTTATGLYKATGGLCGNFESRPIGDRIDLIKPPYRSDDILYVRETWCKARDVPGWEEYRYDSGAAVAPDEYCFKAGSENLDPSIRWRPSIHMPREAARIFLRVTDVRAERLQDITEGGAKSEGAKEKRDFIRIWNNTVPDKDNQQLVWSANPWVWMIEFERTVRPNED